MKLLPALVCLAVALTGCIGDGPQPPPAPPGGPPPSPPSAPGNDTVEPAALAPVVVRFEGAAAGLQTPIAYVAPGSGEHVFAFNVTPNATGIVLELAWEGAEALDLLVQAPSEACSQGSDPAGLTAQCPEAPDDQDGASPAKVVITEPELLALAGAWSLGAWAKQSPQPVAFVAWASVFYGPPPPADYTAVGSEPAPG